MAIRPFLPQRQAGAEAPGTKNGWLGTPSLIKGTDSCSLPPKTANSHSSALRATRVSASLFPAPGLFGVTLA